MTDTDTQHPEAVLDVQQTSAEPEPGEGPATHSGETALALLAPVDKSRRRCTATTRAGRPCTNPPMGNDDRCMTHSTDDAVRAVVIAGRARGGQQPRVRVGLPLSALQGVDLSSSEGQLAILEAGTRALATGAISSTTATALAAIVKAAAGIVQADQQQQIEALTRRAEQIIEAQRGA